MSIRGAKLYGPSPPSDTMTNWTLAPLERGVEFVCPNCGRTSIIRNYKARKLGISYKVPCLRLRGPLISSSPRPVRPAYGRHAPSPTTATQPHPQRRVEAP